jgi:hypothetical protein
MMRPCTLLLLLACAARTGLAASLEAGTVFWQADNGQNVCRMWGPAFRMRPLGNAYPLGLSASLLQGTFNQGGDRETQREFLTTADWAGRWGVLSAGYAHHSIKTALQRGFVWSYPDEEQERNADVHGPYLAYGLTWPAARPLRAVLAAGWLPWDAGELGALGFDGAFYELGCGAQWAASRLRGEVGYRYRAYDDMPDRVINEASYDRSVQEGWYLSLLFRF